MSNILEYIIKIKDLATGPMAKFGESVTKVFAKLEADEKRLMKTNELYGKSFDGIGKSIDRLRAKAHGIVIVSSKDIANVRALNSEIKRLESLQNKIGSMNGSKLKTWGKDAFSQIPGMGLATNPLVMAGTAAFMSAKQGMRQQGIDSAIKFSMGNEAGTDALKHIRNTSNTLGLDLNASMVGAKTLFGSMRGYDPKQQIALFDAVSEAATVFKLTGEDVKGTYLALGQIASKGTVSAEELRGQMGERIPGAFDIAAKSMGVTTEQLGDMLKAGDLAAKDFLPAFAQELHKTFGEQAKKDSNSAQANLNRFFNNLYEMMNYFSTVILPPVTTALGWVNTAFKFIIDNADAIGVSLGIVGAGFVYLKLGMVAEQFGRLIMMVRAFSAALIASPLFPVALALIAIGAIVIGLKKKFGSLQNAWQAMTSIWFNTKGILIAFFTDIGDAINNGIQVGVLRAMAKLDILVQKIRNAASASIMFLSGNFEGASNAWDKEETSDYDKLADVLMKARDKRSAVNHRVADAYWQNNVDLWKNNNGYTAPKEDEAGSDNYKYAGATIPKSGLGSGGGSVDKSSVKGASDGITGGGTRNVYINLGKFQDAINIYVQNTKDGIDRLQEHVEDAMLRVLNSAGQ